MVENSSFNTPVLFIPYDRPEIAEVTFSEIMRVKPRKLYVFIDGINKKYYNGEKIQKCKELLNSINWPCKLSTNFQTLNLGAGKAVPEAISWVFQNEESAIILEEDCVPAMPFFSFCNILLEKYKLDTRICMISGNNPSEYFNNTNDSYFFSKYGHIWGWATWKRAWDQYDFVMKDWPKFKETNQLSNIFTNKLEQKYHFQYFDKFYSKKEKHTWDIQWYYCRIKEYGLSIVPSNNLVMNIGVQGANSRGRNKAHFIPVNENYRIISIPQFVLCNSYYDINHFNQVLYTKRFMLIRILKKVWRIIKGINKK